MIQKIDTNEPTGGSGGTSKVTQYIAQVKDNWLPIAIVVVFAVIILVALNRPG
jgi:hypothetical protein